MLRLLQFRFYIHRFFFLNAFLDSRLVTWHIFIRIEISDNSRTKTMVQFFLAFCQNIRVLKYVFFQDLRGFRL